MQVENRVHPDAAQMATLHRPAADGEAGLAGHLILDATPAMAATRR